jgi:hypothetical protein
MRMGELDSVQETKNKLLDFWFPRTITMKSTVWVTMPCAIVRRQPNFGMFLLGLLFDPEMEATYSSETSGSPQNYTAIQHRKPFYFLRNKVL